MARRTHLPVSGSHRETEIHGDGIRVHDLRNDIGVVEARRRFGGFDIPATLAGMLAGVGTAVILAGIVAGGSTIGYQRGVRGTDTSLSIGGLAAGFATLLVSFLIAGWVAGRMARYDGGRNGVLTAVWFVVLAGGLAALGGILGDRYDVFSRLNLPQWFDSDAMTGTAILTGLAALAIMLLAGYLGGIAGSRYHRRADALIANTREGGVAVPGAINRTVAGRTDIDRTGIDRTDIDRTGIDRTDIDRTDIVQDDVDLVERQRHLSDTMVHGEGEVTGDLRNQRVEDRRSR